MLNTEQLAVLLDRTQHLAACATRSPKKTHQQREGWSVFWRKDVFEVDVYFCNDVGYRLGVMGVGVLANINYGKKLEEFCTPPVVDGDFEDVVKQLDHCIDFWHKGVIE